MELFKNDRYITPGVKNNVPPHVAIAMWQLIDHISVERDYLQIFTLSIIGEGDTRVQVIQHHQEQPDYHSPVVYIPYGPYYKGKVYAVDDGSASVMCLASER